MENENIDLNKEEPKEVEVKTNMDKEDSKNNKKPKLSKEEKKLKKEEAKLIKVTYDGKDFKVPKAMVFEMSKREFKIREDTKKISQGEVAVLMLRESSVGDLKYVKPSNGMFIVEGRYYHIIDACNFNIGKKRIPLAVIPEWSFIPLSKKEYEVKLGAKYQDAQQLIIKSLENAEIVKINQETAPKGQANGKLIIGIVIAAVIGLFFINKYFGGA